MDKGDKNTVSEPLEPWVERIIDRSLLRHQATCPVPNQIKTVAERVQLVEIRFAYLVGYMVGSGVVGGAIGGFLSSKLF